MRCRSRRCRCEHEWRPNGPLRENGELFTNLIPSSSEVLSFVILLVLAPTPTATALQRGQKKQNPIETKMKTEKITDTQEIVPAPSQVRKGGAGPAHVATVKGCGPRGKGSFTGSSLIVHSKTACRSFTNVRRSRSFTSGGSCEFHRVVHGIRSRQRDSSRTRVHGRCCSTESRCHCSCRHMLRRCTSDNRCLENWSRCL